WVIGRALAMRRVQATSDGSSNRRLTSGWSTVNRGRPTCCWSMKMSSPNGAVEMSSHGDMGDRDDESQGGPPAGRGAAWGGREDHDRRGSAGLEDDSAAV